MGKESLVSVEEGLFRGCDAVCCVVGEGVVLEEEKGFTDGTVWAVLDLEVHRREGGRGRALFVGRKVFIEKTQDPLGEPWSGLVQILSRSRPNV